MNKESEVVFLTRGEISIFSEFYLSIHLKQDDPRQKDIAKLLSQKKLKILTINPKLEPGFSKLHSNNWYLIQTLEYLSSSDDDKYTHFRFKYKFDPKKFLWEKGAGVRLLTDDEIEKAKKTLTI